MASTIRIELCQTAEQAAAREAYWRRLSQQTGQAIQVRTITASPGQDIDARLARVTGSVAANNIASADVGSELGKFAVEAIIG
jgi:hypothetical protein